MKDPAHIGGVGFWEQSLSVTHELADAAQDNPTLLLWSKLRKCCFLSLPSNALHCRTATPRACLDSLVEVRGVLPFSPLLCFSLALWSGSTTCSVAQQGDGAASHASQPRWLFLTSKTHPHGSTHAPQGHRAAFSVQKDLEKEAEIQIPSSLWLRCPHRQGPCRNFGSTSCWRDVVV